MLDSNFNKRFRQKNNPMIHHNFVTIIAKKGVRLNETLYTVLTNLDSYPEAYYYSMSSSLHPMFNKKGMRALFDDHAIGLSHMDMIKKISNLKRDTTRYQKFLLVLDFSAFIKIGRDHAFDKGLVKNLNELRQERPDMGLIFIKSEDSSIRYKPQRVCTQSEGCLSYQNADGLQLSISLPDNKLLQELFDISVLKRGVGSINKVHPSATRLDADTISRLKEVHSHLEDYFTPS